MFVLSIFSAAMRQKKCRSATALFVEAMTPSKFVVNKNHDKKGSLSKTGKDTLAAVSFDQKAVFTTSPGLLH